MCTNKHLSLSASAVRFSILILSYIAASNLLPSLNALTKHLHLQGRGHNLLNLLLFEKFNCRWQNSRLQLYLANSDHFYKDIFIYDPTKTMRSRGSLAGLDLSLWKKYTSSCYYLTDKRAFYGEVTQGKCGACDNKIFCSLLCFKTNRLLLGRYSTYGSSRWKVDKKIIASDDDFAQKNWAFHQQVS